MKQEPPIISVIMPCHNRAYDLGRVLAAYDHQQGQVPFELLAVDDGSSDGTLELLRSYQPQGYQIRVHSLGHNQGPGAARNQGIAMARGKLVLFVGDDIVPDGDMVAAHVEQHEVHPEVSHACLGKLTWPSDLPVNTVMRHVDGMGAQQFSYYYLEYDREYDFRHFYTANISVKRALLLQEEAWFDPDFRYAAFEDAEFAFRLRRHGLQIFYSASPHGTHYHYHNVWSFSRRQFIAGQMAYVFDRKHPGALGRLPLFARRSAGILRLALGLVGSDLSQDQRTVAWLEGFGVKLASAFEWLPNSGLDRLYLELFEYFYRKGLWRAALSGPEPTARMQAYLARSMLAPALQRFVNQNQQLNGGLPPGAKGPLKQRLASMRL